MTVKEINDYINKKINENPNFIRYTYFELRVKIGLSTEETEEFLNLNEEFFKDKNYSVYRTEDTFEYNGARHTVQSNELMIIVKRQ